MYKLNYLIILGSLLLFSFSPIHLEEIELNESELICELEAKAFTSSSSTFNDGYNSGLQEGKRLGQLPDPTTYNALWQSYRDYPGNFPQHTQNHPYFRGKYLGIVDGWIVGQQIYYEKLKKSGSGLEIPGPVMCRDQETGMMRPCWLIPVPNQN